MWPNCWLETAQLRKALATVGALVLASCATPQTELATAAAHPDVLCWDERMMVDVGFSSAGQHKCTLDESGLITLTIAPESPPPINCSAWYAFRITPRRPGPVQVKLDYEACRHRYAPKLSKDYTAWMRLADANARTDDSGRSALLTVNLEDMPLFVAGQEIFPAGTYDLWIDRLSRMPDVTRFDAGKSVEGRTIEGLLIGNPDADRIVALIGRQHPPEVTGALAMFPFVETLASDHRLAMKYRQNVLTVVVPIINPDGVENGHWRHNMRDTDLNRDWGPFRQPETQAMRDLLTDLTARQGKELQLLIDFHSTGRDVFYTLPEELETDPPRFTQRWLDRLEERLPQFTVHRDPGHNPGLPVSKAYAYETFGIPAVTFEIGDETDRTMIVKAGQQAALAMTEISLGEIE